MSTYKFQKGDTGLTRNGYKYEVVAEYVGTTGPRILVLRTNTDGTQTAVAVPPEGYWNGVRSGDDLMPPTQKIWIVRAETNYGTPAKAISWEFDNEKEARQNFDSANRMRQYKNVTIEEKEVVCQRSTK